MDLEVPILDRQWAWSTGKWAWFLKISPALRAGFYLDSPLPYPRSATKRIDFSVCMCLLNLGSLSGQQKPVLVQEGDLKKINDAIFRLNGRL